ncbi:MAG: hypothetical protein KVP17_004584 [Porospora cf. gigantea B]|uniref:uncharacterized protein n=1 Tax=Porospora cf. gigantea B TaxID=2853592 RepID=UPI003571964D|nr:MAG: hypothetical protein KVP17_004584 [Porospora cf. gigantea B]
MHLTKTKDKTCLFVSLAATLVGPHQLQRLTEAVVETGTKETEKLATKVSGYIQDTFTQLGNASRQTGMTLPTGNGTTLAPLSKGPSDNDDGGVGFAATVMIFILIALCLAGGVFLARRGRRTPNGQQEHLVEYTPESYTHP